jgi:hypothetical protein
MVTTTQVRFLIGANYGFYFLKNLLTGETGVPRFFKPGESFFFLMKIVAAALPPPA